MVGDTQLPTVVEYELLQLENTHTNGHTTHSQKVEGQRVCSILPTCLGGAVVPTGTGAKVCSVGSSSRVSPLVMVWPRKLIC